MLADIVPDPEKIAERNESATEQRLLSPVDVAIQRGKAFEAQGRFLQAVSEFAEALKLEDDHLEALRGLARVAFGANDSAAAITILDAAIERQPEDATLRALFAKALSGRGENDRAERMLLEAMELGTANIGALDRATWADIAEAAQSIGKMEILLAALDRAEQASSDSPADDRRLGMVCAQVLLPRRAILFGERALARQIDVGSYHSDLGGFYAVAGRIETAADLMDKAIEMEPNPGLMQRRIFIDYFNPNIDEETILRRLRDWDRSIDRSDAPIGHRVKPEPSRKKLRIGYVGADFRIHSNGFAFASLFRGWDIEGFEIFCYNTTEKVDCMTAEFRRVVTAWRNVAHLDPRQIAKQIRADRVDILVDLISHTAGSQLMVFRHKPAPIQVEWNNASGLSEMDWLLTDGVQWPEDGAAVLPEKPWRLDCVAMPIVRAVGFPPPVNPDRPRDGPVTIGFFNNMVKLNDKWMDDAAAILHGAPKAVLAIKFYSVDDTGVRGDLLQRFVDRGIDPERIQMWQRTHRNEHLLDYNKIDLALDPHPGNGGVTTWETLLMGIPLVCLRGDRPNGRMSASIMHTLGLDHHVARNRDGYVDVAVRLTQDAGLRRRAAGEILDAVAKCDLLEPSVYVRKVEAAYRGMWRHWCDAQARG